MLRVVVTTELPFVWILEMIDRYVLPAAGIVASLPLSHTGFVVLLLSEYRTSLRMYFFAVVQADFFCRYRRVPDMKTCFADIARNAPRPFTGNDA